MTNKITKVRSDAPERLGKQARAPIMKPNDQMLSGMKRTDFIKRFVAEDRLANYPFDEAVSHDENWGMYCTGDLLPDLTREVARAYELYPRKNGRPDPKILADDILWSVPPEQLYTLAKLPVDQLSVGLILAIVEALGHGFESALSASIARRCMLVLLNRTTADPAMEPVMKRQCPVRIDDGHVRIGYLSKMSLEDASGKWIEECINVDMVSEAEGRTSEVEDARIPGLEEEKRPTSSTERVSEEEGDQQPLWFKRKGVRGRVEVREPIVFGHEDLVKPGTKLDWMDPTFEELVSLKADYAADKERLGDYAREWIVVEHGGQRRRIPSRMVRYC